MFLEGLADRTQQLDVDDMRWLIKKFFPSADEDRAD